MKLAIEELDANLAAELDAPAVDFDLCAVAVDGGELHIAFHRDAKRAGVVFVGSGSNGMTVWTDAESADDAARRFLTGEIAN